MCIAYKMLNAAQHKRIQMHSKPSALHSIEIESIVFEKNACINATQQQCRCKIYCCA